MELLKQMRSVCMKKDELYIVKSKMASGRTVVIV